MRLDERQLVGRDVVFQENGHVLRLAGKAVDALAHVFGWHVQPGANPAHVGVQVLHLITQQ